MVEEQNWSLTQRFIPTTRKTADSRWVDMVNAAQLEEIRDKLRADANAMVAGLSVSQLAIVVPRAKGKSPASMLGKRIAASLFPNAADDVACRIQFDRLLASLARYYRDREEERFNELAQFRQSRGSGGFWSEIRLRETRPFSESITRPSPAVIQHPPPSLDQLIPLLTHVEFSKRVDQTILRLPGSRFG